MRLSSVTPSSSVSSPSPAGETYQVVKAIYGEVTSYQPGELVKARDIHDGKATVTNIHGMGCVVGVPMDRLAKPPSSDRVREAAYRAAWEHVDCDLGWEMANQNASPNSLLAEQIARCKAMVDAALSSPATPEPVSAPAGEVVGALRREIDHALVNDLRLVPAFGQQKGDPAVRVSALEAALSNAPGQEVVPVAHFNNPEEKN